MNTLPTREEARAIASATEQYLDMASTRSARTLASARADGTLKTEQEFISEGVSVVDDRLQGVADILELVDCRACFVHQGMGDATSIVCDNREESEDEACFMCDMIRTEIVFNALKRGGT